jgi:two-component system, chemotaxis family, CheB/CheR fusion protein
VEAEGQQRTLVEELNHRVRNMLTIVSAISSQTLNRSSSLAEFREAFGGRIRAMGAAYGLVSQENWREVSLQEVVARQLQPYRTNGVSIVGPRVLFRPTAALAFGMVIHELATNAVKYGALVHPEGRLDVTWRAEIGENAVISFLWRETCPVEIEKPSRRGFGTELIERELKYVLDAQTQVEFASHGLQLSLRIPAKTDRVRIPSSEEL